MKERQIIDEDHLLGGIPFPENLWRGLLLKNPLTNSNLCTIYSNVALDSLLSTCKMFQGFLLVSPLNIKMS